MKRKKRKYLLLLVPFLVLFGWSLNGCGGGFRYPFATEPQLVSIYPADGAENVERDARVRFEVWPRNASVYIDFFYRNEDGQRRWVSHQQFREQRYDTVRYLLVPYEYLAPDTKYFLIIKISAYLDSGYSYDGSSYREKIIEISFTTGN